jgi:hypothetical protein
VPCAQSVKAGRGLGRGGRLPSDMQDSPQHPGLNLYRNFDLQLETLRPLRQPMSGLEVLTEQHGGPKLIVRHGVWEWSRQIPVAVRRHHRYPVGCNALDPDAARDRAGDPARRARSAQVIGGGVVAGQRPTTG